MQLTDIIFLLNRVTLPHPDDWTADVGDEVKDGVGLEAVDQGGEKQRRGEDLIVGRGKGSTVASHVVQRISCSWWIASKISPHFFWYILIPLMVSRFWPTNIEPISGLNH